MPISMYIKAYMCIKKILPVVFCSLSLLLPLTVLAVSKPAPVATTLKVGVITDSPFALKDGSTYRGLAIELWENVAEKNHWAYRYQFAGADVAPAIAALKAHRYDVLIGPISVNAKRLLAVDFSRPYFINNIGVIEKKKHKSFVSMLSDFLPRTLIFLLLVLACVFAIFLHLLWYFEGGKHPEIASSYRRAISTGIWLHLFKKGFSHTPSTLHGKVTLLMWLVSLVVLFSLFNASVSAAFTVALTKSYEPVATFSDLDKLKVAGIKGVSATTLASNQGLAVQVVPTLDDAVQLLQADQIDAIVYDALAAKDYLHAHEIHTLRMSEFVLGQEQYAFAVPYNSKLLKAMNLSLVQLQENNLANYFCQKYVGSQAKFCQL